MSHSVDDYYDVYDETWRKARKEHTCDACDEPIPAKTDYVRVFILFDGTKHSLKRCARCQAIHLHLRKRGLDHKYDHLWPDEWLNCGESYRDHWGENPPPEIAKLAFALPGEVDKPPLTD